MELFKILPLCLLVIGCASNGPITPAPINVAPMARVYTCADEKAAAAEPVGPMTAKLLEDYRIERAALDAAHGQPKGKCVP